jgi:hypothetical protein
MKMSNPTASVVTTSITATAPLAQYHTLYVQGLPLILDSNGLKQFFSKFGPVSPTTRVISNRGYGFVDFLTQESADAALNAANDMSNLLQINGLHLKVERAKASEAGDITSGGSLTTSSTSDFGITPYHANSSHGNIEGFKRHPSPISTSPSSYPSRNGLSGTFREIGLNYADVASNGSTPTSSPTKLPSHLRTVHVTVLPPLATVGDIQQVFSVFGRIRKILLKNKLVTEPKPMESAVTLWSVKAEFDSGETVNKVMEVCRNEEIPVSKLNNTVVRVGAYQVPPNFVDAVDTLSALGTVIAAELIQTHTTCSIEFESESAVVNCLSYPVFLRGTQLEFLTQLK